ncbi:MAG: phage virion morphogenesis protein [Microscillaceae bacterium]|nr:phage virion morphogenesis protein [Microscillaceae bacterium]MDW8461041.1 phage virion morphogenesis protein [Cytophagales bacterium]
MNKLYEIAQKLRGLPEKIKRQVAVTALNHYKDKFTAGNDEWEGKKWQEPLRKKLAPIKRKDGKGYRKGFSPQDKTRHTLVKTGVLSRSLRYRLEADKVVFYSNVIYAKRHNEGLDGMPKRQFVGMEKSLEKKIEKIIKENLENL